MPLSKTTARILVLTKRQYNNKDLIDDRFGRMREIPYNLARLGYSVEGLCLSYIQKPEEYFVDGSVRWRSINLDRFYVPGVLRYFRQAAVLIRNSDIMWVGSDAFYGWIGWLLARKYRKLLIFDLYDNFEYFLTGNLPVLKQLYRWVVKNADGITCVSRPLAERVKCYGRKSDTYVLENGVRKCLFVPKNKLECRKKLGLPEKAFLVGVAGGIGFHRGTGTLFEAFRTLKNEQLDLHLVLAGKKREPIPQDNRIHYLGLLPQEGVSDVLNALDVAVVCNRENEFGRYCFPQKAREIMACNVPIVAARVGSMAMLLEQFPEWLYTPEDADDLCRVLNHRRQDRRTTYPATVSWSDIAGQLHGIIQEKFCNNARSNLIT
jgi:glycosyltransferase involved in cell wall biosynthesis